MKKKLFCLFLCMLLTLPCCLADSTVFTSEERTGCENTSKSYDRFYASGETGVLIPGLKQDLVPQGITYMESLDQFLFAGYSSVSGNRSALIAVDAKTGEITKQVLLNTVTGDPYTGHAGGVCVTEKDIYVSNAHMLYRISLNTFYALPEIAECAFEEQIPVPVNSSYCSYSDGILFVGEFEYGSDYKTDKSHKIKTADGNVKAWTCGYYLGEDGFAGKKSAEGTPIPDFILATPERIQGIALLDGNVYISQSYGRRNSSLIMRFDGLINQEPDGETAFGGESIPVWYLDKNHRTDSLLCPPMTECLCSSQGSVYVLFESAANTYRKEGNASSNPMDRIFRLTGF